MALKEGEIRYECALCGEKYSDPIPATKSIKILALGNSFTVDGTHHLWDICKSGGAEEVVVGNLYIGGCTLDTHWSNISGDAAAYTYYKNTDGEWSTTKDYKVIDALTQEDWDYIVLHQAGGSSGFASSFSHLDDIIGFMNENKTNPDAKVVWHMAWAYQSDSTQEAFEKYDRDQTKMYEETMARVHEIILSRDTISAVIPAGTAIQNLRTSYVGDHVTRDGYHMNYGFGRYTVSLTWYAILTGGSVDQVNWIPEKYPDVAGYLPVLKESVKNALEEPYYVLESSYGTDKIPVSSEPIDPSAVLDPADYLEADTALAKAFGTDLSNYTLLTWDYLKNTYWNCTSRAGTNTPGSTASTYNQNICTKNKYSVEKELPVGTIFICDPGWRYRLEIFPDATSKYTGTRPEGCTVPFLILSEEILNGCTYIAWDVSSEPKTDISNIFDQAYAHIRVYVPNS